MSEVESTTNAGSEVASVTAGIEAARAVEAAKQDSKDVSNGQEDSAAQSKDAANTDDTDGTKADDATSTAQDSDSESDKTEEVKDFEISLPDDSIIKDAAEFKTLLDGATKSQEGFNKLSDYIKELGDTAAEQQAKQDKEAWENTLTKWEGELKKDDVFGKDYKGNTDLALKTAESIGLDKWLKETGFDKNPDVLRAMAKIGKERADAEMILGKGGSGNSHPKNRDGTHKFVFETLENN